MAYSLLGFSDRLCSKAEDPSLWKKKNIQDYIGHCKARENLRQGSDSVLQPEDVCWSLNPWHQHAQVSFQVFDFKVNDKEMTASLRFYWNWRVCVLPEMVNMEKQPYNVGYWSPVSWWVCLVGPLFLVCKSFLLSFILAKTVRHHVVLSLM